MEQQVQRPKGFQTGKEALLEIMVQTNHVSKPRSSLYLIRDQIIKLREEAAKAKKRWERFKHLCQSELGLRQHKDDEINAWIEWRTLEAKLTRLLFP